jgi:hypothetical protein
MKLKIEAIGFIAFAIIIVFAGCIETGPFVGEPIHFGELTIIHLNETKNLEDNSISIQLTKISTGGCRPQGIFGTVCENVIPTATFIVKNVQTGQEQDLNVTIIFTGDIVQPNAAIPFTSYKMMVTPSQQTDSVTLLISNNEQNQSEEWLSYKPIQCGQNPWEKWHKDLNRTYIRAPTEQEIVKEYYRTVYEIEILEFKNIPAPSGTNVCKACTCQRGDTIFVLVDEKNIAKMLELGWKKKAIACTQEAKICPDGSTVGRTAPNCEFAPCPNSAGH